MPKGLDVSEPSVVSQLPAPGRRGCCDRNSFTGMSPPNKGLLPHEHGTAFPTRTAPEMHQRGPISLLLLCMAVSAEPLCPNPIPPHGCGVPGSVLCKSLPKQTSPGFLFTLQSRCGLSTISIYIYNLYPFCTRAQTPHSRAGRNNKNGIISLSIALQDQEILGAVKSSWCGWEPPWRYLSIPHPKTIHQLCH